MPKEDREASGETKDIVGGISGLDLAGRTFDFGHGIQLRGTFAHLISTDVLAFERPGKPGLHHPATWHALSQRPGVDILAELFLPKEFAHSALPNMAILETLVSLFRLWVDPRIDLTVVAYEPISRIGEAKDVKIGAHVAAFLRHRERHFQIAPKSEDKLLDRFSWVLDNWEAAVDLQACSPEFRLALATLDTAQTIPNSAMSLVALWGALEAIFAPHKAELKFRVSALLAAYLTPRGDLRVEKQKTIARLYDVRSRAAHGQPKHGGDDVVATMELLRMAIIRMIEGRRVPTASDLETLLFGL
jgi:hypothetical protein